jgi:hypothetical protein
VYQQQIIWNRNKENNPISNSIKDKKYWDTTLTKEVKDLNTENYKSLMKNWR